MEKQILVSIDHDETQLAVFEDRQLVEYEVDRPLNQRIVGNIYKGRVENVLPGMQSAFVNIGLERNAFLFVDDAYPGVPLDGEQLPPGADTRSIQEVLHAGQEVLVQVVKEPVGTKGARVTRKLTLPGRFLVLQPASEHVGVSRRIADEAERERLRAIAQSVQTPGLGLIVRTAAEGQEEAELRRDAEYLARLWERLLRKAQEAKPGTLIHKDAGVVYRVLRDELDESVTRILVDDRHEFERILELLEIFAPALKSRVELYHDPERPLFELYGVEQELERALSRRVWLKSGGYLVIDQTEALTAIDVNTGRYVGSDDLQETVFHTNLEAAREIARQVRLRDIGGIIVIDFIDMEVGEHRQAVLRALEEALQRDRTKSSVLGLTELGLVEMTRKKGRRNLLEAMTRPCPYCSGRGRVLSEEATSRKIRREIKRILRTSDAEAILLEAHPSVAALLIGPGGANLKELERETRRTIFIRGSEECHLEEMNLRALGDRAEVEAKALPVHAGERLEVEVAEPHAANPQDGIARLQGYVIDIVGGGSMVGRKVRVEVTRAFRTYAKARLLEPAEA
ncbi:MAG: Rne/Rng family ribonuclease [Bacillota bacterium]|nr:Rne/Rng family ribonuclease [Bacillota bacterium]